MALFSVMLMLDGTNDAMRGFVEAQSPEEAVEKIETFVKNAPLQGGYKLTVMGEGKTIHVGKRGDS